jgi:hypothetical protein
MDVEHLENIRDSLTELIGTATIARNVPRATSAVRDTVKSARSTA